MRAIVSGKVLITGVNGFIAAWTAKAFLEAGFSVRGTVRSLAKAAHLKTMFDEYGDKFEIVAVEDFTKEGAFDEAILNVDAIVHAASPVHLNAVEPSEVIDPAVNGTLELLRSATRPRASVKRIVYLPSCATIVDRCSTKPRVYYKTCWNDVDVKQVEEMGRDAPAIAKYSASKTLAEKCAWDFYERQKTTLPWDLVVINPPWVFGPCIHEVGSTPPSLNDSNRILCGVITTGMSPVPYHCWIDVRDLTGAQLRAVMTPAASGQRFIVTPGLFTWNDFVAAACRISGETPPPRTVLNAAQVTHLIAYDASKAARILDVTYRDIQETTRDVLKDWKGRRWL
ncbi:NAD-P-binding protein [Trametes maxima]|nr:NAD-P-binding protein [Trametes maxima]